MPQLYIAAFTDRDLAHDIQGGRKSQEEAEEDEEMLFHKGPLRVLPLYDTILLKNKSSPY